MRYLLIKFIIENSNFEYQDVYNMLDRKNNEGQSYINQQASFHEKFIEDLQKNEQDQIQLNTINQKLTTFNEELKNNLD